MLVTLEEPSPVTRTLVTSYILQMNGLPPIDSPSIVTETL